MSSAKKYSPLTLSGLVLIAILLIVGLVWLNARAPSAPPILTNVTLLPEPRDLSTFALTDEQGQNFSEVNFQGDWSLLFFGFTNCPDVCPIEMAQLAQMQRLLESDESSDILPQVYLVSVDPERDDAATLNQYVKAFHVDFRGLTGEVEQMQVLTDQLGIPHFKVPLDDEGNYAVEHSAAIIVLNPEGQYQGVINGSHDASTLASDFMLIRDYLSS